MDLLVYYQSNPSRLHRQTTQAASRKACANWCQLETLYTNAGHTGGT